MSHVRIRTIDVFRAFTMFLMIFVNDLWTLTDVPKWLEHTLVEEDGMGFSDVIFPLFLFIVGLSIPLAINVRKSRKESQGSILGHIATRTIALLVMGFYMVNYGVINQQATGMDKNIWQILMATAIFLIWMDYKRFHIVQKGMVFALKIFGVLILLYLAWVYQGGPVDQLSWMRPRWWGILGLIGWAYLLNSLVFLWMGRKVFNVALVFILLMFMNIQENGFYEGVPSLKLVVSASNHALVMAGMLCTMFYLKFKRDRKSIEHFLGFTLLAGGLFITFGFLIRPVFPISKILATPSWTSICIGISLISYALLYVLVDIKGYAGWANYIKSAGTSTLTCYLMPYFIYPLIVLVGFQWPELISTGAVGLLKSLLFSFAIIVFVRFLEKNHIRLKI